MVTFKGLTLDKNNVDNFLNVINKYSKGGKNTAKESKSSYDLSGNVSIIPDGVLHREKNDLPKDAQAILGRKGIPVVDLNGGMEKVAEIEKEEFILRKEVAKNITDLVYSYLDSGNEAIAEQIGNIIYKEIKTNTNDYTDKFLSKDNGINKVK